MDITNTCQIITSDSFSTIFLNSVIIFFKIISRNSDNQTYNLTIITSDETRFIHDNILREYPPRYSLNFHEQTTPVHTLER